MEYRRYTRQSAPGTPMVPPMQEPCACGVPCQPGAVQMPAMAYVPDLDFTEILPTEAAFCAGTIFSCLNLPFYGKGCC